jgi:hypothetical protein
MRLISVETRRLHEFIGEDPPYAILSHTWEDGQVATFQEMVQKPAGGLDTRKNGHKKIDMECR